VVSVRSLSGGLCRSCRDARERGAEAERSRAAIRSLLGRDDVLILDTETTGMGDAEVIELSVIDTRGELRLDTLVKPRRRRMNPYAQRVHGISFAMLEDAPEWPQVLPDLKRLVDRSTVLAWNAPFDARMLEQTSSTWQLDHPRILFVCAMRLYAGLQPRSRRALHKAVAYQGLSHLLERHRSHRALGDVHLVLEVLERAIQAPTPRR
jgi:DNA polymerase-3 subunit epsilon